MQSEVATGTIVGGFFVVSLIGEGAMGRVYVAEDLQRQRRVALKLLVPELARDERFRQRFLRESRLASRLDHPHVVPTLAFGEESGVLYIAMGYVEGADLREVLRHEGNLEPERALDLLGQVADGLDAAHALGLVHRDVKPANIKLTRSPSKPVRLKEEKEDKTRQEARELTTARAAHDLADELHHVPGLD